jgi:hypothetical protein
VGGVDGNILARPYGRRRAKLARTLGPMREPAKISKFQRILKWCPEEGCRKLSLYNALAAGAGEFNPFDRELQFSAAAAPPPQLPVRVEVPAATHPGTVLGATLVEYGFKVLNCRRRVRSFRAMDTRQSSARNLAPSWP